MESPKETFLGRHPLLSSPGLLVLQGLSWVRWLRWRVERTQSAKGLSPWPGVNLLSLWTNGRGLHAGWSWASSVIVHGSLCSPLPWVCVISLPKSLFLPHTLGTGLGEIELTDLEFSSPMSCSQSIRRCYTSHQEWWATGGYNACRLQQCLDWHSIRSVQWWRSIWRDLRLIGKEGIQTRSSKSSQFLMKPNAAISRNQYNF